MPTNVYVAAITSALSAALAPTLTALVIIFHWHYTTQDQANLILAAGSLLTVAATIVTVFLLHGHAKVAVAKINASNAAQPSFTTGSSSTFTLAAPPARKRPSRAKKTPPAA